MYKKKSIHPVVFIHVPKTGGTSLHSFLAEGLAGNSFSPARFYPQLLNATQDELLSHGVFSGHYGIKDCKKLEKVSNPKYITVLRDPVERAVSLYNFWRSHKDTYSGTPEGDPFHAGVIHAIKSKTLDDFLNTNDPAVLATFSNTHCRFISSTPRKYNDLGDKAQVYFFAKSVYRLLRNYSWYGTMDDLNNNPSSLWDALGISNATHVTMPRLNQTPSAHKKGSRIDITETARKRLEDLNWADIQLYNYVVKHPFTRNIKNFELTQQLAQ